MLEKDAILVLSSVSSLSVRLNSTLEREQKLNEEHMQHLGQARRRYKITKQLMASESSAREDVIKLTKERTRLIEKNEVFKSRSSKLEVDLATVRERMDEMEKK